MKWYIAIISGVFLNLGFIDFMINLNHIDITMTIIDAILSAFGIYFLIYGLASFVYSPRKISQIKFGEGGKE